MKKILSLDVSASSTGWAVLVPGDVRRLLETNNLDWLQILDVLRLSRTSKNWKVYGDGECSLVHGAWRLKNEYSAEGEPHSTFKRNLWLVKKVFGVEFIVFERPLAQSQRGGASNEGNDITVELIGTLKEFCFDAKIRKLYNLHRASWEKDFIGSQKRGTKRKTIQNLVDERAEQLGFVFRKNDEAAAIGLLQLQLLNSGTQPPWLDGEVLRPILGGSK